MDNGYLFFCKSCGLPQRITNYIINKYFKNYGVQGFYCSNCGEYYKLSDSEKHVLLND